MYISEFQGGGWIPIHLRSSASQVFLRASVAYDGATGAKVKTIDPPTVLKAHGWIQIGTILNNATGVQQGYAEVRRTAGTNPFLTYAVVNDGAGPGQRTGDGAYVGSNE